MAHKKPAQPAYDHLPLLPLRDMVVFPRMVVPLLVGRPASLAAIEEALASDRPLFLCTQRDMEADSPAKGDLYEVGVAASVLQTLRMPDGATKVVVEGLARGRVQGLRRRDTYDEVTVERLESANPPTEETLVLMRMTLSQFEEYSRLSGRIAPEVVASLRGADEPDALADHLCAYLPFRVEERQELLEGVEVDGRFELISSRLMREIELLQIEHQVRDRIRDQMDRGQREHYLQEQLRAIQQELGARGEGIEDGAELRELIDKVKMPKEAREKALRELERYERMPPMNPESSILRTYIEWLTDMPWNKRTRDRIDLDEAKRALDEDHYGLKEVKERILEFLAVRKLSKSTKGPVLCLVGPPGVGKTSLGQSVARAMGRKFVRISLGGIRDEAEIRGHRRTYIGSLPGRIIQSIKKAGVKNPVFMLDEVDKMSMDFRGDPSSALLEVLDPEQNMAFSDHYLEVDFDLHEVFFITTANSEFAIPAPLDDRMEVVRLSGYTTFEKERIGRLFLIPKQMKECGLTDAHIRITQGAVYALIEQYTREAGVRELERQIANIFRKVARNVVTKGRSRRVVVSEKRVGELLGPPKYPDSRADAEPQVGLAVGLAWTWAGGEILNIETSTMRGKGNLVLTGQLGEIMKESAQAAYTYLRAHARELKIRTQFHSTLDLHVHVPEGAIPKDGPSAGVPLAVSMLSALRNEAPAKGIAMTGEITLRGRVLAIGGVKEKVLAAHRAGIRTVFMPKANEKDLAEIPKEVKKDLRITLVDSVDEVFRIVLGKKGRKKKSTA